LERALQVHLQFHPLLDGVLHPRLEHGEAVLALPLGVVHRDVGVAQQLFGRGALPVAMPMLAFTNTGVSPPSSLNGAVKRVEQALGDQLRAAAERDALGDDDELVAAEAAERVGARARRRRAAPRPRTAARRRCRARASR
jgi:hypothetical protein